MSMEEPTEIPVTFGELSAAAREDRWPMVDMVLPQCANDPEFLDQATQHLNDPDSNVRDLAASTFEASAVEPDAEATEKLTTLVRDEAKTSYARFRAACALAKHGLYSSQVLSVLEDFANNPDEEVAAIARDYLERYEPRQPD